MSPARAPAYRDRTYGRQEFELRHFCSRSRLTRWRQPVERILGKRFGGNFPGRGRAEASEGGIGPGLEVLVALIGVFAGRSRHSSLSASRAQRASGVWPASYSATMLARKESLRAGGRTLGAGGGI